MAQHSGRMTHRRHRFATVVKRFDQRNRMAVFSQVPQRAVAAGIEHGIEIRSLYRVQLDCRRQCRLGGRILAKALGCGGLRIGLVTFRVQRWLAPLGRGQRQLRAGILEHVIRRGEFFQPEAGFLAGITQLIVGR